MEESNLYGAYLFDSVVLGSWECICSALVCTSVDLDSSGLRLRVKQLTR